MGACGTHTVVPSMTPVATATVGTALEVSATPTPVVPLTDTPISPTITTVPIDPTPVGLWQDSLSVEYTPEEDSAYSFVDQSGEKTILRIPVGNASINALFSAVDNDIVSARVTNSSGTVDMTVSDFEVEPLEFVPPGYPEETQLSRFTTKAVNIPVTFGDVLTVTFTGEDGSTGTTTYAVHPSIQDSIGANIQALGMHGAVVNLGPPPTFAHLFDWNTYLQDHSVTFNLSQDGKIVQRDVPIEVDQGITFAELVDFSFQLGMPIDVVITISQNGNSNNHTAQISLPGLQQYLPFLMPIFHQSDINEFGISGLITIDIHGTEPGEPFPYYAVDFIGPISSQTGVATIITGLPIYLQEMQVLRLYCVNPEEGCNPEKNINAYLYAPDLGLTFFLTHVKPSDKLINLINPGNDALPDDFYEVSFPGSDKYTLGPDVAYFLVGRGGDETVVSHLHLAAQVPYPLVKDRVPISESETGWNISTGISHLDAAYKGACPRLDGEPGYGVGPCPELLPEGTLFVNLPELLVTDSWIDPSK